jgi:Protein of unknown function (DUF2568)
VRTLATVNLGVRFLLELAALAAVGYWGWQAGDGLLRWVLAIGAVIVVAVIWGLFVSPKAAIDVAPPLRFGIELVVWAAAAVALYSAGHALVALAFFAVALVSGGLNYAWRTGPGVGGSTAS